MDETTWTSFLLLLLSEHGGKDTLHYKYILKHYGSLSADFVLMLDAEQLKNVKKEPKRIHQYPHLQLLKSVSTSQKDKLTRSSVWDIDMLAHYITYKEYVKKLEFEIDSSNVDARIIKKVLDEHILMKRHTSIHKESDSRMFIDKLLQPLCTQYDVELQTEVSIKSGCLPSSRLDYLLTKKGMPFGCVEAKYFKTLTDMSFAQVVIQLCCLQLIASNAGMNVERTPVFAVVTDSHRFVFLQLQGRQLRLEHDPVSNINRIKIRRLEIDNYCSYKEIIGLLNKLIEESLDNSDCSSVRSHICNVADVALDTNSLTQ